MIEGLLVRIMRNTMKYMDYEGYNLAFVFHALIEIPAAINFMFVPSKQLGKYTPHAHAIIRQYALLLLVSVLISLTFATRPTDDLSRMVAGSLAMYHIGPALRSVGRLRQQAAQAKPLLLSEAALYLVVHIACGTSLTVCYLGDGPANGARAP